MSDRPEDIEQWAWDEAAKAIGVPEDDTGWHLTGDLLEPISRALLKAREEERGAWLKATEAWFDQETAQSFTDLADAFVKDMRAGVETKLVSASAIRQHSQKGER